MGSRRNRFGGLGGSRIRIPRPDPIIDRAGGGGVDRIAIPDPRIGRPTFPPVFRRTDTRGTRVEPLTIMKIFQVFDDEDVVNNVSQRVTEGLFTGGTGSLTSFFTSSVQSGSTGNYFYNVFNVDPSTSDVEEVQFAISYGHVSGAGAPDLNDDDNALLETQTTYFQHRNILLDPGDELFTFADNFDSDDIYIINVQRARLKQKIDKGNWQLTLSGSGTTGTSSITLIDDSGDISDQKTSEGGRVFNIVSGALDIGANTSSIEKAAANEPSGGYGLFFPDVGIFILNPTAISHSLGLEADTTSSNDFVNNHGNFLGLIQSGSDFQARNEENVTSTFFFVRVKNRDYNFSNNPSFVTGSVGEFTQQSFVGDPRTFITTVGLFSDENELLAVGKLSAPLLKSFERETLIKIKLDF